MDPAAHGEARPRLQQWASSNVDLHLVLTNFRNIRKAVTDVDARLAGEGVNGILMDLGMSSMQVGFVLNPKPYTLLRGFPLD